jgi:hypothetical protein
MVLSWSDSTSYSQGQRTHIEPREWTVTIGGMRLVLHRFHGCDPTIWFGTVYGGPPINRYELKSVPAKDAQAELVKLVRERLEAMLNAIRSA